MPTTHLELTLRRYLGAGGEGERFVLGPGAEAALARALAMDLKSAEPATALTRMLRLIAALETKLQSRTAAEALRTLLRSNATALALIRQAQLPPSSLDTARSFARREGREVTLRAPSVATGQEPRGLQVKDFLDPGGGRSREASRAQGPPLRSKARSRD